MIDGLIAGKIYGTPARRTGKSGSTFVVAKVRTPTTGADSIFVSAICFSDTAGEALMALDDGDSVALSGELTPKVWTGHQDGAPRPGLDMTVHAVLTAYNVTRKRKAVQGDGSSPRQGSAPSGRAFEQWQAAQLPADDFADMGDVL